MSNTLPGARTPVVNLDPNTGLMTFSRTWFLFFQALWLKTGGASDDPSADAQILALDSIESVDRATFLNRLTALETLTLDTDLSAAAGTVSPLTTKGDLLGFDTAPNRIPVGFDGTVLTADSTQALGIGWAAAPGADFDATGWRLAPVIWGGEPDSVYGGVLGLDGGGPLTNYAGLQPLDASDNNLNGGVGATIRGVQGPQGLVGLPATNFLQIFEFFAALDGVQTVSLPYPLGSGWYLLCINGMRQDSGDYTVSGTSLTLPSAVLAGDFISFEYYTPTV